MVVKEHPRRQRDWLGPVSVPNAQPNTFEEALAKALHAVASAHEEGHISEEDSETLLREILSAWLYDRIHSTIVDLPHSSLPSRWRARFVNQGWPSGQALGHRRVW